MGVLRDRMIEEMKLRNFSPATHYLGRYTHRVALSNDRILSAHNGEVTFSYDTAMGPGLELMHIG